MSASAIWRQLRNRMPRRAAVVCDQIVHVIVLSDTQTIASPVVMEVRAEVEWFVQIMIRRKKLKTITPSNVVKKIGPKEGRTIQIGNARLTWKASGEDTGYGTSVYEMDLAPGVGIPIHSHPYAEVFYVISGHTDFLRIDEQGQTKWIRCGPGDTLVAPINALHAFHNRTDRPSRFISSSVYYHQVALDRYGIRVNFDDPLPAAREPSAAEADQYLEILKDAVAVDLHFPQANAANGLEVFRDIEMRNRQHPDSDIEQS
jgi:quercetin dioxygenase-like cupin family protein